ncbi:MAG: MMPL family transporter [Bacteriovorax sp.]|jgi:hypothetical protein
MKRLLFSKKSLILCFIALNILFALLSYSLIQNISPFEIKSRLGPDHPVRIQYEKDLKSFNDESLAWIQIESLEGPFRTSEIVFISNQIINKLKSSRWFEDPIGPSNAKYFEIDSLGIVFKKFYEKNELTKEGFEKLQTPFWKNTFITDDRKSFLISFRFNKYVPIFTEKPELDKLKEFLEQLKENNPRINFGLIGAKIASAEFFEEMMFQQIVITPILIFLIGGFFYYMYRSWQIVAWSFYVLFICYAATLALIILVENGVGPYSSFALMFSMIIATTDLIHLWSRLNQLTGPFEVRLKNAFESARYPCLLTSLTTAIGFFALIINQNIPVRYFGLYCAFSCLFEWFFIFYFMPSILTLFKFKSLQHSVISNSIHQLTHRMIFSHSKKIIASSLIILILLAAYSFKIKVDDNFYTKFEDNHFLSKSLRSLTNHFKFSGTIDLLYQLGDLPPADEKFIDLTSQIDKELVQIKHVTKINSLAMLNHEIEASSKKNNLVKADRMTIINFMNDYGMLSQVYNEKNRTSRTTLYLDSLSTEDLDYVIGKIDLIKDKYKDKISFNVSGFANIRSYINSRVIKDFYESFIISFFLIFWCYYWLYKDLKLSILALLPNALPILAISGLLGFFNISVDVNLVILVCVAFGISGDNTIHLSYVAREFQKTGKSYSESIHSSLHLIGSALWGTSAIFIITLPIFLLGHLKLFHYLSTFLVTAFIVAFVSDLIVFPSIQKEWEKLKLK